MQLYKYLPLASDRMGALWTLAPIKDICILEYGPAGTTHYGIEGFMHLNTEMRARLFTTHMDETDIVMGDSTRLEKTIREIDEVYAPAVIFVVASSISSIIGTDIETICHAVQPETKSKLIAITGGGFRGDFALGVREVLTALANHVVQVPSTKRPKTYNIIGLNPDCFNFLSDLREIKTLMQDCFGYTAHTVFTTGTTISEIQSAAEAEFNLVLRTEGVECAKLLKTRHGMPYLHAVPYGFMGTLKWLEQVSNTFNLVANPGFMAQLTSVGQRHIRGFRRGQYGYKPLSAIVSGNYDQAVGMAAFLMQELGCPVKKIIVNHAKTQGAMELPSPLTELVTFNPSEAAKESIVRELNPAILLGDDILLAIAQEVPIKHQVANPNLHATLIHDGTPHMGFRGAAYLLERLLNGLHQQAAKLTAR